MSTFYPDTGSKFFRPQLTNDDLTQAMKVSPLFLAYLQTKIEAYATSLVDTPLVYDPDPAKQVTAIINYERSRTFVQAYEELLAELLDAQDKDMDDSNRR